MFSGSRAAIWFALTSLLCGARLEASQITVHLDAVGELPENLSSITVRLNPEDTSNHLSQGQPSSSDSAPEPIKASINRGASRTFDLKDGVIWSIRAEGDQVWSPERFVQTDQQVRSIHLPLFQVGQVRAKVKLARIGEMPEVLRVRFQPSEDSGKGRSAEAGAVDCPVKEGTAECAVPAGKLDLRISGSPYSPVYRLGTEIGPGVVSTLEAISLVRGASVSGFVVSESGDPAPAGTQVRISVGGTADPRFERRLNLVNTTTHTDEYGFFQFLGLLPGHYTVIAEAKGFAPARVGPIEARADLESALAGPLVLANPIKLDLGVDPARDPWGEDWRIELSQVDPESDRWLNTVEGSTAEGQYIRKGLAPGTYRLAIIGSEDTRWLEQTIQLSAGEEPLFFQIPILRVEGSLSVGDDPAPGQLWFGTRRGERRVRFDIDEQGEFEGALPGPGRWRLEWIPEGRRRTSVILPPVEVPDKPKVTLDLQVPDTRLVGKVVDRQGEPVQGATVTAVGGDKGSTPSRVETDEDGSFSLLGLEPGGYAVKAERASASSAMLPVDLAEGRDAPELRLVLQETAPLYGRVESGGRAVAGARVTIWPNLGSSAGVSFLNAVTGPDGLFQVDAPVDSDQFNVLSIAPGFGTRLANLARSSDQLLVIEMNPNPGSLDLGSVEDLDPSTFVVHDGAFLSLQAFLQISRRFGGGGLRGGAATISGLDPGNYALCRGTGALSALRASVFAAAPFCNYGVLPPLGTLNLAPPSGSSG